MAKKELIWKNRRLRQVFILVTISFILLWLILGILFYRFSYNRYEQSTLMRLAGISNSLALQIDGNIHQDLMNTYDTIQTAEALDADTSYQNINQVLKDNHTANMLKSPIYTLIMTDDHKSYQFGVTSDSLPYFRHRYVSFHPILNEKFESGGMIKAYRDEFGMWLSAFAPIKTKEGKVVGVVMVDEKFDNFVLAARRQVIETMLIALALFVFMTFSLLWLLKNILNRENKDKLAIEKANQENLKINSKLIEANQKLKNLDKFRKEMISNISHDLRTPISGILGFLELIKTKDENLSLAQKTIYIDIAYSESQRLNRLVTDLFELTKLDSGQVKLNKEAFDIYELVSDIIQKYQLKIDEKKVSLGFEIHDNLGLAFGDIKYIDRVFQNLLDNAVRYVNVGGVMKIWILDQGELIKIKICNSGEIIPKSELELIFNRYYNSNKSDQVGHGLGLAIAKSICELHGCTITAESTDTLNSFWFTVQKFDPKLQ